jgi:hypothetical protein
MQETCHILLKSSRQGLKLCFDLILIRGLQKRLWASIMARILISKIARLSIWESQKKHHFGVALIMNHR